MRRENQVATYLSDEELARVDEWCDETEKSRSTLLREAVIEYVDHDRAARIEGQVRELNQKVETVMAHLDEDTTHTHTSGQSTSIGCAREMIGRIQRNHKEVIKADDVDRTIEDYAGADDRTLQKYKRIFRDRGLLFEHPGDRPIWTTERDMWAEWVVDYARLNGGEAAAEEVVDDYPARVNANLDQSGFTIELENAEVES